VLLKLTLLLSLQSITLHFVVLSFDRYSRDDIIGEVFCSLGMADLSQAENQNLTLCREIHPRSLKVNACLPLAHTLLSINPRSLNITACLLACHCHINCVRYNLGMTK
jgi:hypothetical protein